MMRCRRCLHPVYGEWNSHTKHATYTHTNAVGEYFKFHPTFETEYTCHAGFIEKEGVYDDEAV